MVTLIKNGDVYAPEALGKKDILIAGNTVEAIREPGNIRLNGIDYKIIEAEGKIVIPGFIDSHVHILGGGGEGGPRTRAPEISFEEIITSGVTTVIGCLGTDGITRHMSSLLAKAVGLEKEGLTTYIFTGSYAIPVITLTGSVQRDLVLIEKVIGAGEIALSDHRSAQPTFDNFAALAAECRVGGMLGGKAGVLHCHMGSGKRGLEMIHRLIGNTEIPPTQVIPTHINRSFILLEDAVPFMEKGGYVDLTAGLNPTSNEEMLSVRACVEYLKEKNLPMEQITISSDSNGSLPVFDEKGVLTGLTIATEKSLLLNFRHLVLEAGLSLQNCVRMFSTNVADFYKFERKGRIEIGYEGDILCLDKDLTLTDVLLLGKWVMADKKILARGTFSR